jgi:hypothetical protein
MPQLAFAISHHDGAAYPAAVIRGNFTCEAPPLSSGSAHVHFKNIAGTDAARLQSVACDYTTVKALVG